MELKNFDQLVSTVKGMSEKRVVAVAAAADQHVIESVLEAKQEGIAQPILVGDAGEIKKIMGTMGLNPSDFDIVDAPGTPADAAVKAVEVIKAGDANFLMKGMIETTDLLRPVVKKENNLRTGRTMRFTCPSTSLTPTTRSSSTPTAACAPIPICRRRRRSSSMPWRPSAPWATSCPR